MKAKFTPGPWEVEKYDSGERGIITRNPLTFPPTEEGEEIEAVVICHGAMSEEEARLIAAAPIMYQDLSDTVDFIWKELRENPDKEDMDGSIMDRLIDLQTGLLETLRKIRGEA
jgi:hypothetical protein